MIDVEAQVFTKVYDAVVAAYPNADVLGETVLAPSKFPCVCIEEADNAIWRNSRDSGSNENHVTVMYEVNIYSNKKSGKKAECKEILGVVDDIMVGMGFTRTMKEPASMDDATKYRLVTRYTAIISKNETIYRR